MAAASSSSSAPSGNVGAATAIPTIERVLEGIEGIDYVNGPYVSSPTTEWESIRLFGQSEFDVRVVLYRDHASWCPYCHKVQLLLEMKRIPYVIKKENMNSYGSKSKEFLKRNPAGLLPVILLDGELRKESTPIMFLIEESFPKPYVRSIPADDNDRMQAFHRFMRLEKVLTGVWLTALTSPPATYGVTKSPLKHGLDFVEKGLFEFMGPFFLGEEPSFIDIQFAPILMRASSTLKYFRNMDICEGRPYLADWFKAMNEWEPSRKLISDDISYALSISPQVGSCRFLNERTEISTNVDTERSKHMLDTGDERAMDRLEAAERFCGNFEAVLKDAYKGARTMDAAKPAVELAFRAVAAALGDHLEIEALEDSLKAEVIEEDRLPAASALKFLRSRVCTPRDMTVDGSVQFCGAINWCIRALGHEP